jgi:hypothetical protein
VLWRKSAFDPKRTFGRDDFIGRDWIRSGSSSLPRAATKREVVAIGSLRHRPTTIFTAN